MLLNKAEFQQLKDCTIESASLFDDIEGVLITGSLVQKIQLPEPPKCPQLSELAQTYAKIVGRTRRKLFPHIDSDFDFWIMTKEQPGNEHLSTYLDEKALQLIKWYSEQKTVDLAEWIYKKKEAFGHIYKQPFLYSKEWNDCSGVIPSHSEGFKSVLVDEIKNRIPSLVDKVSYYFRKGIPGDFLETRSFPASTFNLKPEKIMVDGCENKTPFPFYIRDWIDIDRNCIVLYTKQDSKDMIYPFNPNGHVPGENIAKALNWTPHHIDHVLYKPGCEGEQFDVKHF